MSETSLTLYDVESNLQAFADTEDGGTITDEQRAEFESELSTALSQAVEKRDHFAQWIRMNETLAAATGEEIKRLQARKKRLEAQAERAKEFGARVILNLGPDAKGRYRKLEGKTATLAVKKNPDTVQITDETAVPEAFKTVTVSVSIDKRKVKAAIDAGEQIPGADVAFGSYRLEVR